VILSGLEKGIKEKIERIGIPLKDWDIQINYGIKTGFNGPLEEGGCFIITGEKRNELIEQDPKSAEVIRPILRGRDIKRYSHEFADLWLIYIPWHFPLHNDETIRGASLLAEETFKNQYPAIYSHLLKYKNELSNRNKAETGIRYEWYALQRWGANYWEDFFKQKIIFQEMVQESSFILDHQGNFMCLDTARIITGNDLDILIAVLNSRLFFYSVKTFYGGGGLGETGVRMKHTFFENFPMPNFSAPDKANLRSLISNLDNNALAEIDKIIYKTFTLTKEEKDLIESQ